MITPIEMYTMVPKNQEATHIRAGEQARDMSQQAGTLQSIEQRAVENTQRTTKMSETENPDYRYDAKEKGNGEYSSDGERKKKEQEKRNHPSGPVNMSRHPGGIDIRI